MKKPFADTVPRAQPTGLPAPQPGMRKPAGQQSDAERRAYADTEPMVFPDTVVPEADE